ncbi:glutaminase, partial [Streptomyces sp. NPDC041003]|uniref:glutaminase n=1 Tax=Streptomyces sp. NPDC041003 TaxID=3155730 RepID=UPI0033CCED25
MDTAPFDYGALLERIVADIAPLLGSGTPAEYIPALASVDPGHFGMAVADLDGNVFGVGDWQ